MDKNKHILNERQICEDRLELAFLARGTDAKGYFCKVTGDLGKEED
jgi:hypothetical protein